MPVIDNRGQDITDMVLAAADQAGIPPLLLLGCMYGESGGLDQFSERWGTRTSEAKDAIARSDWSTLQAIINSVWADVSFGRSQRIVKYHYTGNTRPTVENCLAVREYVFSHPEQDLIEMAKKLAGNLRTAQANDLSLFGGDANLAACAIYNSGHPLTPAEWSRYGPRVNNYRRGLEQAKASLPVFPDPEPTTGDSVMTIEEKVVALGGKLGNVDGNGNPIPETGVYDLGNGLRMQVFWNGMLWEYTKPDGNTDVQVCVSAEATAHDIAAFQS